MGVKKQFQEVNLPKLSQNYDFVANELQISHGLLYLQDGKLIRRQYLWYDATSHIEAAMKWLHLT